MANRYRGIAEESLLYLIVADQVGLDHIPIHVDEMVLDDAEAHLWGDYSHLGLYILLQNEIVNAGLV